MNYKVCIIGWYGTETLGDRAILDGIFQILKATYANVDIYLGSLYPFFTERTLYEDKDIYERSLGGAHIDIFDSKNKKELYSIIKQSDLIAVGGGPLMDLNELYIIQRAFNFANKIGVKKVILGCGLGPLHTPRLESVVRKILTLSDLVVLRDIFSYEIAKKMGCYSAEILCDPAIISVLEYQRLTNHKVTRVNKVAVNLRKFDNTYGVEIDNINKQFVKLLKCLSEQFDIVHLIPMHTFSIGGDDRMFYQNMLANTDIILENIKVQNIPQNLYELYEAFTEAEACIGMRYHSVLMQSLLNGNNYILDYTQPEVGKISGFIQKIKGKEFYYNRLCNLQCDELNTESCIKVLMSNKKFEVQLDRISIINNYRDLLQKGK